MEQNPHSLQDYSGSEYFFQAIEMANEEMASSELEADFFSWKVVKRRQKPQRRYTVSHAAPPAPPSTPTSLSKEHNDPLSELSSLSMSPTEQNQNIENDECRLGSLLYILDYAPKYKKKLKEQQRTDNELAELFKVVTITGSGVNGSTSATSGNGLNRGNEKGNPSSKSSIEHGVSFNSRRIRRPDMNAGVFRIHRNSDDTAKDLHDEDSLSAPEFEVDNDVKDVTTSRPWRRLKFDNRGRMKYRDRNAKRIAKIIDTFDSTMSFQSAQ